MADVQMSTLKSKPPPTLDDEESRPISRTPSPIPEGGVRTVRGEHYDYAAVPTEEPSASSSLSVTRQPSPRN